MNRIFNWKMIFSQEEDSHLDFSRLAGRYVFNGVILDRPRPRTQRDSYSAYSRNRSTYHQSQDFNRERQTSEFHRQDQLEKHPLMKSFRKYRVQKLVKIFAEKLKRNVVLRKPYDLTDQPSSSNLLQRLFGQTQGIQMNNFWIIVMQALGLAIITWLVIVYTLVLVFRSVQQTQMFQTTQLISLVFYLSKTTTNFFLKTYDEGKSVEEIKLIITDYLGTRFAVDLGFLILLVVDLVYDFEEMAYLRLVFLFRFFSEIQKMDKLEAIVCTTSRREHQWGLALLFLVNFLFAHMLSVLLNSMAFISEQSWWHTHNLLEEPWYVRYIFGYYWAINIMLTVGFGDLVATNWKEALCLIFIETFSCIIFSYNINCVGNLINSLRLQQVEKQKNLKNFRRMCESAKTTQSKIVDLQNRINHFIEKSFETKHSYDLSAETQTLSLLPEKLSSQFTRRVNSKMLQNLYFFKDITKKCIQDIAVKLQKRITLPQQIVIRKGDRSKLMVLFKGQAYYIGHQQKRGKRDYIIVQRISSSPSNSRLISFSDFLKTRQHKYDVMSADYSIIFILQHQSFVQSLRQHKFDYEKYCQLRDNNQNQIQGLQCHICNVKTHTKFECPRLHYMPLKELICLRHRNEQMPHIRQPYERMKSRHENINLVYVQNDLPRSIGDLRSMHNQSKDSFKSFLEEERNPPLELDRVYVWKYYSPNNNIGNCLRRKKRP